MVEWIIGKVFIDLIYTWHDYSKLIIAIFNYVYGQCTKKDEDII